MWKQKAAQVIPIVISSTGVITKSLSQSQTRLNLHPKTYTTAKICNSWHMFNYKQLFRLQIRPPSLILLITTSQDRWIFPSQRWEVRISMMMIMRIVNCPAQPPWHHILRKLIMLIIQLTSECQIQEMYRFAENEKVRKCAELSTEVKKVASRSGACLTCHYICNRNRSSLTAWCPQATRLTRFVVGDHKKTCKLKSMQHGKFIGDSTVQQ